MSNKKKKKKHINLEKNTFPRNIRWMHDFDYIDQLTEEEKEWLDKFAKEYINGNVKKGDKDALHKSDAQRKDCYNKKNRQNRDLLSILDSSGKVHPIIDDLDSDD